MKNILLSAFLFCGACANAQSPPWENPLRMAWSANGTTFGPSVIFQDSAGVPCVVHWKGRGFIF